MTFTGGGSSKQADSIGPRVPATFRSYSQQPAASADSKVYRAPVQLDNVRESGASESRAPLRGGGEGIGGSV